jgi:F-box interacting protein
VSKVWCSLISGGEFAEVYRARAQPILIDVGAGSQKNPSDDPDLRLIDLDGNVLRVFKGLGGLGTICTSMDNLICVIRGTSEGVHVVDPATGNVLMRCSTVEVKEHHVYPYIRTLIYTTFGFGRAAASGEYKIIRLLVDGRTCEVLTIGDDATAGWRQADSIPANISEPRGIPVAINGVLHFLVSTGDEPYGVSLSCFDLESEQWKKKMIQGPGDGKVADRRRVGITELNGSLCMAKAMEQYTDIWLLVDSDKSVWRKMCTIPYAISALVSTCR